MYSKTVSRAILLTLVFVLVTQVGAYGGVLDEKYNADRSSHLTATMRFDAPLSSFELTRIGDYDYIFSEGMEPFTEPGQPMLPMIASVMEFDRDVEILEVSASSETRVEIQGSYDLAPTPEPLTWGVDFVGDYEKDQEIYSLDDYFPGDSFSYRVGEDNHNKYIYVHFYPIQYNPVRGEVELVSQLSLDILYERSPDVQPLADDLTAECVIITPSSLHSQATQLADFHEVSLGVPTSVVNTSWIDSNYAEAPDPPYSGYRDAGLPGRGQITGYDYSLAKKTVNFLDNQSAHPNLNSVLIYGNAEFVPPSYYYYDVNYGPFSSYEGWIPTDYFYSSPDHDLTPNYAVGRLPVDGTLRAFDVNQKIMDWYSNLSPTWFEKAAIAGGKPFNTMFYIGELINQDSLNRGYFDGFDITKMHATDGRFGKDPVLDALK
ncbi:MAG: hypothetical protein KAW09_02835, partial [Thermoplasmata archaeon]|nr:hypothetical protein [Thermoplasmata archaeon]